MDIENFYKINGLYHIEHGITKNDIKMAENYIDYIEKTRSDKIPKVGDIVKYTTEYGDYYGRALISANSGANEIQICEQPYVPFICSTNNDDMSLSVSGGAFTHTNKNNLKYLGKEKRQFCDWGSCGACANGAVDFEAEVSVWEYKENNMFGEYSTKYYNKMYIKKKEKPINGYIIFGDGIAFETEKDYQAFLKTYRAKEFDNDYNTVIFYYKEENYLISKEEWQELEGYQIDTRKCNASIITVKVKYDEENKRIKVYRYKNSFKSEEEIANKPYILNR
mgnify:FL=1